ncbi:hypothetical protein VTI74DRAFT_5629 [Chaetomium olivicolor]
MRKLAAQTSQRFSQMRSARPCRTLALGTGNYQGCSLGTPHCWQGTQQAGKEVDVTYKSAAKPSLAIISCSPPPILFTFILAGAD